MKTLVLLFVLPPSMTARPPYTHSPFAAAAPYPVSGMRAPAGGRVSRIAYVLSWSLLGVASVAGLAFSLYRNDVLLNAARSGGWEPRYLAMEARLLGTPGWGTPRSLSAADPAFAESGAAEAALAPVRTALPSTPEIAPSTPAESAPSTARASRPAAEPSAPHATSDGVAIVSLDALATEKAKSVVVAAPLPARPATARVAERPAPAPKAVAPKAVAQAPAPKAVAQASAPKAVAPKAVAAKPAAPARAAAAPVANDTFLKAAIRSAIVNDTGAH